MCQNIQREVYQMSRKSNALNACQLIQKQYSLSVWELHGIFGSYWIIYFHLGAKLQLRFISTFCSHQLFWCANLKSLLHNSVKLMLLNADAIWTISNVTKFSLLSHFLRKCSRVEGSSFFGCCQAIRCFSGLRFVSQVSHGEGTGSSGPFLPPPACEHRPCSYETFLLWDSSAVQPVIPEHEDDTHCPAGTAEEPKGYFLAEGI